MQLPTRRFRPVAEPRRMSLITCRLRAEARCVSCPGTWAALASSYSTTQQLTSSHLVSHILVPLVHIVLTVTCMSPLPQSVGYLTRYRGSCGSWDLGFRCSCLYAATYSELRRPMEPWMNLCCRSRIFSAVTMPWKISSAVEMTMAGVLPSPLCLCQADLVPAPPSSVVMTTLLSFFPPFSNSIDNLQQGRGEGKRNPVSTSYHPQSQFLRQK